MDQGDAILTIAYGDLQHNAQGRLAAAQRETEMYRQQLTISEAEKTRLMDLLTEAQRRRSLWEIIFGQGSS